MRPLIRGTPGFPSAVVARTSISKRRKYGRERIRLLIEPAPIEISRRGIDDVPRKFHSARDLTLLRVRLAR